MTFSGRDLPDYQTRQFKTTKRPRRREECRHGTVSRQKGGHHRRHERHGARDGKGGARILVTGRSQTGLDSAKQELGNDALIVSSDARSLNDIDALGARVKAEFDTFDLLFVNAGFSAFAPLESMTEAVYDDMFSLNAKGPFFAVQKLAPMITRGGSVVFTTSTANIKGMPMIAAYGGAKAAMR